MFGYNSSKIKVLKVFLVAMAGDGRERDANPQGGDANLLLGQFFPKLHENERNWIQREGGMSPAPHRSANVT